MKFRIILFLSIVITGSCKENVIPKPKAMLSLEFQSGEYETFENDCGYSFEKNKLAHLKIEDNCAMVLDYPMMKGSIYLTYKSVENNIRELLLDAEKLTYEHVVKADAIAPKEFRNDTRKVYGMFYEVTGNAASQSQFYVTDSVNHFLTGSLYFYAKPNYDSIYPAAVYLQQDIRRIMESLHWEKESP